MIPECIDKNGDEYNRRKIIIVCHYIIKNYALKEECKVSETSKYNSCKLYFIYYICGAIGYSNSVRSKIQGMIVSLRNRKEELDYDKIINEYRESEYQLSENEFQELCKHFEIRFNEEWIAIGRNYIELCSFNSIYTREEIEKRFMNNEYILYDENIGIPAVSKSKDKCNQNNNQNTKYQNVDDETVNGACKVFVGGIVSDMRRLDGIYSMIERIDDAIENDKVYDQIDANKKGTKRDCYKLLFNSIQLMIYHLSLCESPIEAIFLNAWHERTFNYMFTEIDYNYLTLFPQYNIGKYRVDFSSQLHKVVVELDGHEYHKTKEQRGYDAKKDRFLTLNGSIVIRATGSQIYNKKELDELIDDLFGIVYDKVIMELQPELADKDLVLANQITANIARGR